MRNIRVQIERMRSPAERAGPINISTMADSGDDVDDVEEQEFLVFSSELGAEFVRLVLEDTLTGRNVGTSSMGPGDHKDRGGASGSNEESQKGNSVVKNLGLQLRQAGDELNTPELEQTVLQVMSPMLQKISVFQVTQVIFSDICDRVLGNIQTNNGWTQVRAVYHVMLELIRRLREEDTNISREAAFRSFAGRYLIQVGLSVNMRTLIGSIVDKVFFPSVDISYEPPQ